MCLPSIENSKKADVEGKTYLLSTRQTNLFLACDLDFLQGRGLCQSLGMSGKGPNDTIWFLVVLTEEAVNTLKEDSDVKISIAPPACYSTWLGCGRGHKTLYILEAGGKACAPEELEQTPQLPSFVASEHIK